jgi:beta-lactamase superfamily II metal-dependent hydrolase
MKLKAITRGCFRGPAVALALSALVTGCVTPAGKEAPPPATTPSVPVPPPPAASGLDHSLIRGGGPNKLLTVSVLSVGSGSCAVIACPNGTRIIDDCGTSSGNGMTDSAIEWLRYAVTADSGRPPLYVVTSHGDRDHTNLIPDALSTDIKVDGFYYGGDWSGYPKYIKDWESGAEQAYGFKRAYPAQGRYGYDPANTPNSNLSCTAGVTGDGLWVLSQNAGDAKNDQSVAVKVSRGLRSVILMGDAESGTETAIKNTYNASFVHANLLVAAHHGSDKGTNTPEWGYAVAPEAVVFSAGTGYENYGHPRCSSVEVYRNANNLVKTAAHDMACYDGPYNSNTSSFKGVEQAAYNTAQSGALVYITDGDMEEVWTCSGNDVNKCQRSAPAP